MAQQTRLKLCGITRLEDARYAAGAMVDYLGFVFHPESPRYISPRDVSEIVGWIEGPKKVGVFFNQKIDDVNRIIQRTGIDLVQLHGDETPEYVSKIAAPVIKTLRIRPGDDLLKITNHVNTWVDKVAYFMFDSFDKDRPGGTGLQWDWSLLTGLTSQIPFFLAGGLTVDNVEEAVSMVAPYGIDLSSSLEAAPGVKDVEKMQLFFDRWNSMDIGGSRNSNNYQNDYE